MFVCFCFFFFFREGFLPWLVPRVPGLPFDAFERLAFLPGRRPWPFMDVIHIITTSLNLHQHQLIRGKMNLRCRQVINTVDSFLQRGQFTFEVLMPSQSLNRLQISTQFFRVQFGDFLFHPFGGFVARPVKQFNAKPKTNKLNTFFFKQDSLVVDTCWLPVGYALWPGVVCWWNPTGRECFWLGRECWQAQRL